MIGQSDSEQRALQLTRCLPYRKREPIRMAMTRGKGLLFGLSADGIMKGRCIGRRAASSAIVLLLAATLGAQESSLFDRLISDREDTREKAIDEATRLAPPIRQQLITRLIERLPSKGLDSYFASLTLGRFGESAVASLIGAVHSDNPDVRYRASEALGRIGAPALDPVTAVLSDPSAELRCAAWHAW